MLKGTNLIGGGGGGPAGPALLTVQGADFDGSNDYMGSQAAFASSDGNKILLSVWINVTSISTFSAIIGTNRTGIGDPGATVTTAGAVLFTANTDGSNKYYSVTDDETISASAGWQHIIFQYSSNPFYYNCYIDGSTSGTSTTNSAGSGFNMVNTGIEDQIGVMNTASYFFPGGMAELWISYGETYDVTVQSNREKFRSADGKPVDLGADGSAPTGTQPQAYFSLREGDSIGAFNTNKGSGANCTVHNGPLTISSSSPSD